MFSVYILCRKENGGSTKIMRIKNINKRNGEKVNKSNYPPHFENHGLQNVG